MGVNVGRPNVLIKLDERDGKLTFGGVPVCDGQHSGEETPVVVASAAVTLVDNFADLDPNAADGSLALAWNPEYALSQLQLGAYNEEKERYLLPNQLVAFSPEIEYRESVYTNALQTFLARYPLEYYQYATGTTFSRDRAEHGVFRKNGDGTFTDITDSIRIGDDISAYWYAYREHSFGMEAGVSTTHKDWTVWGREEMFLCAIPVVADAQDNIYIRERIECKSILESGIVAPNAETKYVIAAAWEGDPLQRTFLDLFPGASKISGNIYRVPIMFLYAFEDMDASIVAEDEDDPSVTEVVSFHLQTGWNAVYVTAAMRLDAREKEWRMDSADFDSVVPMDGAPHFAAQTDETGTIEYERENGDLLFSGALMRKTELHTAGLYIKTEHWQPIQASMLPKIDVNKHDDAINVLYERVDEMTNDLEDNPPYHRNRYVLDALSEDNGALVYNGTHIRTISSIDLDGQYNGFDSYRINFTDGTQEYFNVLHSNGGGITSVLFQTNEEPGIDRCSVKYENGTVSNFPVSGLDLSIAFANNNDPMPHQDRRFGDTRVYVKLAGDGANTENYRHFIDFSDSDHDTAKLDYIDMVLGTGFETVCLFERARRNYEAGFWTTEHLRQAVVHGWINEADYKSLTGDVYVPDEEEETNDQG